MKHPIDCIVDSLKDNKQYSLLEICSQSATRKNYTRLVLSSGEKDVFVAVSSKWHLAKDVRVERIDRLKTDLKNETEEYLRQRKDKVEAKIALKQRREKQAIHRAAIALKGRKRSSSQGLQIVHSEGEDSTHIPLRLWSDGLTKSRVKTYQGPQGMYWADPNFKKKEY